MLHHAVRAADTELLQYLLECGATVNCVDSEGCSPLHLLAAGQRTPKQGAGIVGGVFKHSNNGKLKSLCILKKYYPAYELTEASASAIFFNFGFGSASA